MSQSAEQSKTALLPYVRSQAPQASIQAILTFLSTPSFKTDDDDARRLKRRRYKTWLRGELAARRLSSWRAQVALVASDGSDDGRVSVSLIAPPWPHQRWSKRFKL